jgi:hypothetical protein
MYVYIRIHTYIRMYIHTYVYVCVCICIHTHIGTRLAHDTFLDERKNPNDPVVVQHVSVLVQINLIKLN